MTASVRLNPHPERHLIRPTGSFRHVDFSIRAAAATRPARGRPGLSLALVLDRSGSMHGDKIRTAREAAATVVQALDERDRVAVVVFDDRIDILQSAARVTSHVKASVRAALERVDARGSTALHQGWLTGCREVAADERPETALNTTELARCFLLTDGLANVGVVDPEQIAAQAADIRRNAGVGTSTFGIGLDYAEHLLGPVAVAGAGQFHHLRTAADMRRTFSGELTELLAVVASGVRLELRTDPRVSIEVISQYFADTRVGAAAIDIGDLMADEERHVVVRFGFPPLPTTDPSTMYLECRLAWLADGVPCTSDWSGLPFSYASQSACDQEVRDPSVMHWVGLHHADRARREAMVLSRAGNSVAARKRLQQVAGHIREYAGDDHELVATEQDLESMDAQVSAGPVAPSVAKEVYSTAQRRSRGQRDLREP
jgi:Ca-activated chloride channel family protein